MTYKGNGCQVEDGLWRDALHNSLQLFVILQVSHGIVGHARLRRMAQPPDVPTVICQLLREIAPSEPTGAGDQRTPWFLAWMKCHRRL